MPRIAYLEQRFQAATLAVIEQANTIVRDYQAQGYDLTLRQVYYQFVSRGLMGNNDRNYKRLGDIINNGRLAGLIDWNAIQDRTRYLRSDGGWDSPEQIIEASAAGYGRDLWRVTDQQYRPEVWVEKDALVGVIERACKPLKVPFFSCRGYVSQSEMWTAGRRMQRHRQQGKTPVVIHLGDHDPSGLDMTRDITDRLAMFAERPVHVDRIALTMDQVEQYSPPPNPTKMSDSRGEGYLQEYGDESWELDALEPSVLVALITEALEPFIDQAAWDEGEQEDQEERERMGVVAERWSDLVENWTDVQALLDGAL